MARAAAKPAVGAARIIKSLIAEGMIARFPEARIGKVSCTELCVLLMFRPMGASAQRSVSCVSVLGAGQLVRRVRRASDAAGRVERSHRMLRMPLARGPAVCSTESHMCLSIVLLRR